MTPEERAGLISEIGNLHMEWGDNVAAEVAAAIRADREEQREAEWITVSPETMPEECESVLVA
jgi:hypothetical protein